MTYAIVGEQGQVTSWAGAFYTTLLAAITPNTAQITMDNPSQETTGLNTGTYAGIPGLLSWSGSVSGTAFSAARLGNQGLITFSAGGYVLHASRWSVNLSAPTHDITEYNATAPTWRRFRPGYVTGTCEFECGVDDATAIVAPHLAAASLPTVTFRYGDSATDETIAGSVMLTGANTSVSRGSATRVSYSGTFAGAITPAGTGSVFGASAFGIPLWDEGVPAATSLVLAARTGARTFTGDAFWTSLGITCEVGSPVSVEIGFQGTNALTIA